MRAPRVDPEAPVAVPEWEPIPLELPLYDEPHVRKPPSVDGGSTPEETPPGVIVIDLLGEGEEDPET